MAETAYALQDSRADVKLPANVPDDLSAASSTDAPSSGGAERQRWYRYSLLSSLISKGSTALLQVICLPLMTAALGPKGFALYAMISAAGSWLALANIGWGPNLAVRIARNRVAGSEDVEKELFSSAFYSNLGISLLVVIVAGLAVVLGPTGSVFGETYASDHKAITLGLLALILFFFCQVNLLIFESARAGYQLQYEINLVGAVAAIPTFLAIYLTLQLKPGPVELIIATIAPGVILRFFYAAYVWWTNDKFRPSLRRYSKTLSRSLAGDGLFYVLAGGVGNLLAHVFPVLLVGRIFSPEITAAFSVSMTLVLLFMGAVSIISAPLLPALADSLARGDKQWAYSTYRKIRNRTIGFTGAIVACLLLFQGQIFTLWLGGKLRMPVELLVASGIYLIASAWEVMHFSVLVGIGEVRKASILVFSRCVVGAIAMILIVPLAGETFAYVSMVACILVIFSVPAVLIVRRKLLAP